MVYTKALFTQCTLVVHLGWLLKDIMMLVVSAAYLLGNFARSIQSAAVATLNACKREVNKTSHTIEVLGRRLVIYPALLWYGQPYTHLHQTALRGHV